MCCFFSQQFQISFQNVTIMHAKASLCQNDLCSSNSFQIPSECTIQRLLFFSAVPTRSKCRQNAPFIVLDINLFHCSSKQYRMLSECTIQRPCFHFFFCSFKCRQNALYLASLFSKCSLKFHIVSDTVRMHHLSSLFSFVFSAFPNSSECRQNALFSVLVFKMFSEVPYRMTDAVRMHHLSSLFLIFFLWLQIVSNSVRIYALSCS